MEPIHSGLGNLFGMIWTEGTAVGVSEDTRRIDRLGLFSHSGPSLVNRGHAQYEPLEGTARQPTKPGLLRGESQGCHGTTRRFDRRLVHMDDGHG